MIFRIDFDSYNMFTNIKSTLNKLIRGKNKQI